jgi:hypothetical protein
VKPFQIALMLEGQPRRWGRAASRANLQAILPRMPSDKGGPLMTLIRTL